MLDLDVNLSLAGPRGAVHLKGRGDRMTVRAERLGAVVALARTLRRLPPISPFVGSLPPGGAGLVAAGLVCDFEVDGRFLGRAGLGVRPSWWARALRLPAVRVPLYRLMWAWLRRR